MALKALTLILGIVFFILGAISTNIFFQELKTEFVFHPAIELIIISLGVLLLSAFFYGKLGFLVMLFAGSYIGGTFEQTPIFAIASLLPLLLGLMGGTSMGSIAAQDLKGKRNFFDESESFLAYAIIIIVLSLIIGYLFGFETALPFEQYF